MKSTKRIFALIGTSVCLCTASLPLPALAKGGNDAPAPETPFVVQQIRLQPLRQIADALATEGKTEFSGTFTSVYIDQAKARVDLYVTDTKQGESLAEAAKQVHPEIDASKVNIVQAKYSKVDLDRGIDKVFESSSSTSLNIASFYAKTDGSGLAARTSGSKFSSAAAARAADNSLSQIAGIPVDVETGEKIHALSWRWNDSHPVIGGDVGVGKSASLNDRGMCTLGTAVEDSSGKDYILTAAHCYPISATVYGDGGPTGDVNNYSYGSSIGKVVKRSEPYDTELIATPGTNGAGSNSDEADQPANKWIPVTTAAYSYAGDSVCQDGAVSYYTGQGVPCGITVVAPDAHYHVQYDDGTWHNARGVYGSAASGYAGIVGDSGGLVFTITGTNSRESRGGVSAGLNGDIYWGETLDAFKTFGVHLNPHR